MAHTSAVDPNKNKQLRVIQAGEKPSESYLSPGNSKLK